jgi:hypothetical protein
MARLSQSQLTGFRIGNNPPTDPEPRTDALRRRDPAAPPAGQVAPKRIDPSPTVSESRIDGARAHGLLGPVPATPTRGEARHKIGLTLPLELAEQVRALTREGFALADLIMVAYQDQRDRLLDDHHVTNPRRLARQPHGRSPLTVALSHAERAALNALTEHLGWTRSHTVAVLLDRQLRDDPPR